MYTTERKKSSSYSSSLPFPSFFFGDMFRLHAKILDLTPLLLIVVADSESQGAANLFIYFIFAFWVGSY